jgi:3-hydroxybutyryl-CoA dehydrogenase
MADKRYGRIGVAGGGLMGTGIAAKLAVAGQPVMVYESMPAAFAQARKRCAAVFAELVDGGVLSRLDAAAAAERVTVTDDIARMADLRFVIEAVSESLPIKHTLYHALENCLAPDAIIASSTSGLTPTELCEAMWRPERFVVAHFWNPPHLVPLVEVVAGPATLGRVVDETMLLLAELKFGPVKLNKAVPGFVGNRLQFAVLREALHLLSEGVADASTIDFIMKQSVGRRYACIGPLEGADIGGISTFLSISSYLMPALAAEKDAIKILVDMARDGKLGRANGRGFYEWTPEKEEWLRQVRLEILRRSQGYGCGNSPELGDLVYDQSVLA